ncbi:hypothetical protein [Amycolatopsis sp. NPDC058986]|uniref:hypothetical protein n=1 Tax=unclassified Amycolatopsis TaxID=2618356 RepID=UPI00366F1776
MTKAIRKRRGLRPLARAAVLTTLSVAMVGGVASQAMAASDPQYMKELEKTTDSSPRVHIYADLYKNAVVPGQRATVAADFDPWNIWNTFQSSVAGKDDFSITQDLVKFLAWQTSSIRLNDVPCDQYGAGKPGFKVADSKNGFNVDPVDALGLVDQTRAIVGTVFNGVGLNKVGDFLHSRVRAVCTFTVPVDVRGDITVRASVEQRNFLGLFTQVSEGRAFLPVEAPQPPAKPTISGVSNGSLEVPAGGEVTGTGTPGTTVRLKVPNHGDVIEETKTPVDAQGYWRVKLPARFVAGTPYLIQAVSQFPDRPERSESEPTILNVKPNTPDVRQPVITSPQGGTVKPGEELTVTGSDGSVVTPVDQNGKPVGPPVEIKDGQAKVKLNADLPDGANVRIEAKAKDGSGEPVYSDPKKVQTPVTKPTVDKPSGAVQPGGEVTGTAPAGSSVQLKDKDGKPIGQPVTVGPDGRWKATLPAGLAEGPHEVTAEATPSGGQPVQSDPQTIEVKKPDDSAGVPSKPVIETPEPNAEVGPGAEVSGTAPGAEKIQLKGSDGNPIGGPVTVGPDGRWKATLPKDLTVGQHEVTAEASNAKGTTQSDKVPFTIKPGNENDLKDVWQSSLTLGKDNRNVVTVTFNAEGTPVDLGSKAIVFNAPAGIKFTGVATVQWDNGEAANLKVEQSPDGKTLTIVDSAKLRTTDKNKATHFTLVFQVENPPANPDLKLDWNVKVGERTFPLSGGVTNRD